MAMAMKTAHITPLDGERPAQYAERVGKGYAEASIQKDKKKQGAVFHTAGYFGIHGKTG